MLNKKYSSNLKTLKTVKETKKAKESEIKKELGLSEIKYPKLTDYKSTEAFAEFRNYISEFYVNFKSHSFFIDVTKPFVKFELWKKDNLDIFKKNVKDGYLLLLLMNSNDGTFLNYSRNKTDKQTYNVKEFRSYFDKTQWLNLIKSEPVFVLRFYIYYTAWIHSNNSNRLGFRGYGFKNNNVLKFLLPALSVSTLTEYSTHQIIRLLRFESLMRIENESHGFFDLNTNSKFFNECIVPSIKMASRTCFKNSSNEISDHIELIMKFILKNPNDPIPKVNWKWSLNRFMSEHYKLAIALETKKLDSLAKRPVLNLKKLGLAEIKTLVLKGKDKEDITVNVNLLNNEQDFHMESILQRNCVRSYFPKFKRLSYLVFALTHNSDHRKRVTVGFNSFNNFSTNNNSGTSREWYFEQAKGYSNSVPDVPYSYLEAIEKILSFLKSEKASKYLLSKIERPLALLKNSEKAILMSKKGKSIYDAVVEKRSSTFFSDFDITSMYNVEYLDATRRTYSYVIDAGTNSLSSYHSKLLHDKKRTLKGVTRHIKNKKFIYSVFKLPTTNPFTKETVKYFNEDDKKSKFLKSIVSSFNYQTGSYYDRELPLDYDELISGNKLLSELSKFIPFSISIKPLLLGLPKSTDGSNQGESQHSPVTEVKSYFNNILDYLVEM